jgi:DNA polymerase elongation subunit (family B)
LKFYTNVQIRGSRILHRGYEDGKRFSYAEPCRPYLFTGPVNYDTGYTTLKGQYVMKRDFDNPHHAQKYIKENKDIQGKNTYGLPMFAYTYINDNYQGQIKYDADTVRTVYIDIEVAADEGFPDIQKADKEITAITLQFKDQIIAIGGQPYTPKQENVKYIQATDEANLLVRFLDCWQAIDPDIVSGWNVEFFDIPYIINRITRVVGEDYAKKLSPFGQLREREVFIAGRPNQVFDPLGISILDYMQLYRKFTFVMQESYRLDHIAHVELGERKLDYSEHDSLFDLYKHDWEKFIDYNILDTELVKRLDDKLKLIEQVLAIAYDAKVNYQDTFTSVRMWDLIIHNYLLDKNIVVPQFKKIDKERAAEGAYVKDPQVGMHNWVVSFDLNSLYPHLIMQYNISPETYVGKSGRAPSIEEILEGAWNNNTLATAKEENCAISANGDYYTRDFEGFLPKLMRKMYDDRVVWKNRMIEAQKKYEKTPTKALENEIAQCHNMQMAKKIQLNSAYGALGNEYFRWFDMNNTESITKGGQLSIRWAENVINKLLNKTLETDNEDYVIAIDTDSLYINMAPLVHKVFPDGAETKRIIDFLDKSAAEILEPEIEKGYGKLATYVNAMENKMFMKRENIGNKAIWTAKKRYIMNVFDSEGVRYASPKLKMMGIEAVRSSTPAMVRKYIKEALDVIMDKDQEDIIKFIEQKREEFRKLPFEEVAFPRGCKGLAKYSDAAMIYRKGTPIHVRGALMYNHLLNEKKIDRFQPVQEGDKVKFCYLKLPNPSRENVVAVPNTLPKQLGLDAYIDYDMQFDKSFLEPMRTIIEKIGWQVEKQQNLDLFFQ